LCFRLWVLSNTGREITKGIVDVKGDSAESVKTLAVRNGEKKLPLQPQFFTSLQ
jgi:4-hydroxybenzoate polyprenyltransferase